VKVHLYSFLTSTADGDEWSVSRPGRFTPRTQRVGLKRRLHWREDSKSEISVMRKVEGLYEE
jgi:hypothetical protein